LSTDREIQLSKEEEKNLSFEEIPSELNFDESVDEAKECLELRLSLSLYRKLHEKSREENIKVEELASELLAEGLVLRAWEIMERKNTMKGGNYSASSGNNRTQNRPYTRGNGASTYSNQTKVRTHSGNNQFQNKNVRRPKFSHSDLNDGANFIEYVRSQEKKKW
jgi:hypothetical protein